MENTPRIAVLGTGANGASIGADMIRAGHDVTFIDQWAAHVEAMRSNGLTVRLPDAVQHTHPHAFHLCQVAEMRKPFDIVFLSVKTYDTRWTVELIRPLLHEGSIVVGLQNGMTIDDVSDVVGAHRSVGAVLGIAANMFEPGSVERQIPPSGTWFTLGTMTGDPHPLLDAAAEALAASGTVETTSDIRSAKWMKLLANIPEMLPSAILGAPLLTAVDVPGIREVMNAASREAYAVARRLGIEMVPIFGKSAEDVPGSDQYAIDLLDAVLASYSLPDTRVAVLQDWMKGRRAELDAFCGYIVSQGANVGVATPVNDGLLRLAQRIEARDLAPGLEHAALLRHILTAMEHAS